jgi:hypothetical protein
MKKIFTLIAAVALTLTAGAQNYRHWDFTHWSNATVSNLAEEATKGVTGGAWSDTEKADGSNPQVGKCYWAYSADLVDAEGQLLANNTPIAETLGLVFNPNYVSRRSLAIAVDYPSTSLGDYAGPQYLWLGGGKNSIACFTIPKVRVGQKITMIVESHKPAEARGVAIYVGAVDDSHKIGESFTPTTLDTYTWENWELPEASELNEDGETVDVIVYNTNGCHVYDIEVGTNAEKQKVAYLYGGDVDSDLAYAFVSGSDNFDATAIEATATLTLDDIADYDAVVISSTVTDAAALARLNELSPFVPTLNLNPAVYSAWGCGTLVEATTMGIELKNKDHALFRNLEVMEEDGVYGIVITNADSYQAVNLQGRFANDVVLATVFGGTDVAIHGHNLNHNGYLYLPACTQEALPMLADPTIIDNAVMVVAGSKAKVTAAAKPTFTLTYKDRQTTVEMKSTTAGAQVYYTLDGTTPTTASTLYTEPIVITTEGVTVKAVAIADGYLLSEVAEQAVDLKSQALTPLIAVEKQSGSSVVTLSTTQEGASIYYNYSGSNSVKSSALYTEPITVTQLGRVVYAFAQAEGCVDSELASQTVVVDDATVRIDVLAHMDANKDTYFTKGNQSKSSVSYFFSWGSSKAAYSYYNTEEGVQVETVVDPETGEETTTNTYTVLNPEEEVDFENGWAVRSRGQLCMWEQGDFKQDIGDTGYRNPATVEDVNADFPFTNNFLTLADKNTTPSDATFPYNAYIISTQKFKGPFDIVANIGNGAGDESKLDIVLQVAADGNQLESQWQLLGDTIKIVNGRRLIRNITRSYEGTDEVYVRAYLAANNSKAQFYDIYIANEGELSQQRKQEYTGIIATQQQMINDNAVYDLQGRRLNAIPQRGLYIKSGRKYIVK